MTPIGKPQVAGPPSAWQLCFRAGSSRLTLVQSVATLSYGANEPEARFSGSSTFKTHSNFPAVATLEKRIVKGSVTGDRGSKVMGTESPRTKEKK